MGYFSTYTQDNDKQEVDVSDIVKLKPQVLRNEAQWSVLGCPYLVAYEDLLIIAFFRLCFVWERYVHPYLAVFVLFFSCLTHGALVIYGLTLFGPSGFLFV